MENSSTDELKLAHHKKYDRWPKNQRGGVLYLWYTLTAIVTMSRDVKQAMTYYLEYFKIQGLAKVARNNNILQAKSHHQIVLLQGGYELKLLGVIFVFYCYDFVN